MANRNGKLLPKDSGSDSGDSDEAKNLDLDGVSNCSDKTIELDSSLANRWMNDEGNEVDGEGNEMDVDQLFEQQDDDQEAVLEDGMKEPNTEAVKEEVDQCASPKKQLHSGMSGDEDEEYDESDEGEDEDLPESHGVCRWLTGSAWRQEVSTLNHKYESAIQFTKTLAKRNRELSTENRDLKDQLFKAKARKRMHSKSVTNKFGTEIGRKKLKFDSQKSDSETEGLGAIASNTPKKKFQDDGSGSPGAGASGIATN